MNENSYINMTINKKYQEYFKATRKGKSQILTELESLTGRSRASLSRSLRNRLRTPKEDIKAGRPKKYNSKTLKILKLVWEANDYICAERIIDEIPSTIQDYQKLNELKYYKDEDIDKVREIPLGSLKQQLRKIPKPRRKVSCSSSGTKILQKQINIRTKFEKDIKPGFFGVDFVDHNGGSSSGTFARTLQFTDSNITWIARAACLGKTKRVAEEAFETIFPKIPYEMKGLHSDNEPTLLRILLDEKAKAHRIFITRTRSYRSTDNEHVEQKNGDKIRLLLGYKRFDTIEQVDLMNQLYEIDVLFQNHFIRSMKLEKKEYNELGKLTKRVYGKAMTPYERAMTSKDIPLSVKQVLHAKHESLNRIELKRKRDKLLKKLYRL